MRIAYISLHWPRTTTSSVGKKMLRQISAWRTLGHEARLFSHLHPTAEKNLLLDGERFFYSLKSGPFGLIPGELSRIAALKRLAAAVREYQPDVIYLRWAMYVFPLQRLYAIAPAVLEINTNDVEEHKLLGPVKSGYNRLTRSITLGGASGLVYPSQELAEMPVFKSFNKPWVVVGNSIDLETTLSLPAPHNDKPHLAFIGTPGFAWHGVEKLVPLAEQYPDMVIDVIGYDSINGVPHPPANLILHGYLVGEACDRVLAQADAAIGTLALHRAGLNEATPLKVRDCIARGIPCILPYYDSDLADLDNDWILPIPNDETNILSHSRQIHDFVLRSRGRRVPQDLIRDRIDSLAKEKLRLDFMQRICSGSIS